MSMIELYVLIFFVYNARIPEDHPIVWVERQHYLFQTKGECEEIGEVQRKDMQSAYNNAKGDIPQVTFWCEPIRVRKP